MCVVVSFCTFCCCFGYFGVVVVFVCVLFFVVVISVFWGVSAHRPETTLGLNESSDFFQ